LTGERLARAGTEEMAALVEAVKARFIEGRTLSEVTDRLLGAFFLMNEGGKEHTLMNRFLRLTCALEHLAVHDDVGKQNITLWFSLRGMLLSLHGLNGNAIPAKQLEPRVERLRKLREKHGRYPGPDSVVEILKAAYDARSQLAHRWAPGVAGSWYVTLYLDFLYRVVLSAIQTLLAIERSFAICTDRQLTFFYATCFQYLLLLSCREGLERGIPESELLLAYPSGVLRATDEDLPAEERRAIAQAALEVLRRAGLCVPAECKRLRCTPDGAVFGKYLHSRFELRYTYS
jgi:hypothetical protein